MLVEVLPGPKIIKYFSCSTPLSMKFKLLINTEISKINGNISLNHQSQSFILLINVKITIVGILTFMSRVDFMLSWVEHEKSVIISGPGS